MEDQPVSRLERRTQRRTRRWKTNIWTLFYIPLALIPNWGAWVQGPTHTLSSGLGGDGGQEIWFLGITAHQILHFHNPFFTDVMNIPHGVNLADVTSMPLLGGICAPLTWIWGPIFTYNVLTFLSTVGSALTMYWLAGRWIERRSSRFLAGLLYAFSPYMAAQLWGHLFLTMIFVFPIIILSLDEIFVRQNWKPWQSGGLLGLCCIAQIGISPELLLDGAIIGALPAIALLVNLARKPVAASIYALRAIGITVAVAILPTALFVYNFLYGKGHMSGAYRNAAMVSNLKVDFLSMLLPGSIQRFGMHVATKIDALTYFGQAIHTPDPFESGGFISIPLMLLMLGCLPLVWKRREIWVLALGAAISLLISMGSQPTINGHWLRFTGPFSILQDLPLLENSIASRWTLFLWLFVAILAAIIYDRAVTYFQTATQSLRFKQLRAASISLAILAVISLLPRWPMPQQEQQVPKWFLSSKVKTLTPDSVIVTSPLAINGTPLAMMWQSINGFNYRLAHGSAGPQTSEWGPVKAIVAQCDVANAPTIPNLRRLTVAQQQLRRLGVTTLIATNYSANPTCAKIVFSALAGTPGTDELDVRIWRLAPPR